MTPPPVLKYVFVVLASAVVTYLLMPPLMFLSRRIGLMDQPGGRRMHQRATPLCGGIAIFVGLHVGLLATYFLPWGTFAGRVGAENYPELLAMSTLALIFGVIDDFREVRPAVKLAGQILLGTLCYFAGARFDHVFAAQIPTAVAFLATVLWVVGAMNAFNLIDGMDGVAGGLGAIAATGLGLHALFSGNPADALLMIALGAPCLAFLRYNFHPAQAFLGDAGSMLIGFVLAWFSLATATKGTAITSLAVPLLAMGVPILDTVLAIWRRSARSVYFRMRNSSQTARVFGADHDHLHHRLQAMGLSQQRVALILYGAAAVLVVIGLISSMSISHRVGILLAGFAAFSYVVIRHLATVELWDSGRAIAQGMRRPASKVLAVILYPPLDVMTLSVAFAATLYLVYGGDDREAVKTAWLRLAPIGVSAPFLAIALSQAYRRVWSRARVSEFGMLAIATLSGLCIAAATCCYLLGCHRRAGLMFYFAYAGMALPLIMSYRVTPRLFQDALMLISRRQGDAPNAMRTILYGAGFTSTLFLRERSFGDVEGTAAYSICGFIDDDRNLKGRIVHSYRVHGTVRTLAHLIRRFQIEQIIVTANISDQNRQRLDKVCSAHGVEVLEWSSSLRRIQAPGQHHEPLDKSANATLTAGSGACHSDRGTDGAVRPESLADQPRCIRD